MRYFTLLVGALLAVGCGASSSTGGNPDATADSPGAGGDDGAGSATEASGSGGGSSSGGLGSSSGPDASAGADSSSSGSSGGGSSGAGSSSGGGPSDSGSFDGPDVNSPDGACNCQPYWCGCGACDPAAIACDPNPPVCARGCLSSCPELGQVRCSCNQGRCVREGVDASTIGCVQDVDCPAGDCCARVQGKALCVTAPSTCCTVACP